MWPFAKLRNGFGSHRCIYSPILLDSQVANSFYLSTGSSARAGDASPVTTIVPRVVDRQCNGNADGYQLRFLAAGAAPEDDYGDRAFADGQWKCVRPATISASWFSLRDQLLALCFGKGGFLQWGMENVVTHLRPRSRGRWQGPAFTGVFGGQCPNGGDNGGRKDTDQPLFEGLMHNKTSSALFCMAKMPRFLKGA